MHKTRERNAVLIFVAPRAHKFAVVGDKAIHEKCGERILAAYCRWNAGAFSEREVQPRAGRSDQGNRQSAGRAFSENVGKRKRVAGRDCRRLTSKAAAVAGRPDAPAVALPEWPLAKSRIWSLFQAPQRVFEITPLVPGSPSLDARPHSPGGTRRSKEFSD